MINLEGQVGISSLTKETQRIQKQKGVKRLAWFGEVTEVPKFFLLLFEYLKGSLNGYPVN